MFNFFKKNEQPVSLAKPGQTVHPEAAEAVSNDNYTPTLPFITEDFHVGAYLKGPIGLTLIGGEVNECGGVSFLFNDTPQRPQIVSDYFQPGSDSMKYRKALNELKSLADQLKKKSARNRILSHDSDADVPLHFKDKGGRYE